MRRVKRHHVKQERPETSSCVSEAQHDLTYYIHDRVELMHQVFSVLKPKELKAMAPNCVQHISLSDLQELCMEELLGISSKRLCAILDGAEPPSDTETSSTSSPEKFETISLDSISSDEEILSEGSSKKKKKHKHHHCKSRSKHKRRSSSEASEENEDRSKASRAGLTVLELLELQARARAIRAQLQQGQATDITDATASQTVEYVSNDEVEIKEEPAEVVEISSEDEKPKIEDLQKVSAQTSRNTTEDTNNETPTVTKRIKDLIITVPGTKSHRKIKLNRHKPPATLTAHVNTSETTELDKQIVNKEIPQEEAKPANKTSKSLDTSKEKSNPKSLPPEMTKTVKEKQKKKLKKKEKGKVKNKEGSDNDEITLQLSDSEKMDLLEDLDRKNYDVVSSSGTEDSESSSDSSDGDDKRTDRDPISGSSKNTEIDSAIKIAPDTKPPAGDNVDEKSNNDDLHAAEVVADNKNAEESLEQCENIVEEHKAENAAEKSSENDGEPEVGEISNVEQINVQNVCIAQNNLNLEQSSNEEKSVDHEAVTEGMQETNCNLINNFEDTTRVEADCERDVEGCDNKDKSEGELSDRESSEVEATDVKPEVVCISDEDDENKKVHKKKKNKKKEKKAKKEKKSKKCPDFRNEDDQNFYTKPNPKESKNKPDDVGTAATHQGECAEVDVYEILELSDESSCNGEDGNSVLSKEPTAEEIAALSAKIDEIEREEVITEAEIREHEKAEAEKLVEDAENITWKDRYLDSRKVKSVLTTANILNAMRKKNKELKRKLEDSKKESGAAILPPQVAEEAEVNLEEGSIEQYNTLEGSTKYVDPVAEVRDGGTGKPNAGDGKVTNEIRKDAKQLLKMYKKLLNFNDMNRQRDPNKKKKKKHKKSKEEKSKAELSC